MGNLRRSAGQWQAAAICALTLCTCGGGSADKREAPGAAHATPAAAAATEAAPGPVEHADRSAAPAAPIDPPTPSADALAAAKPSPNEPAEFTAIKSRILGGDRGSKPIKELQRLSGKHASCADIPYLLGQLYLEKLWVGDGLKAFRRALEIDSTLRSNPFLIRSVINGLGNDRDHHQVQRFLIQDIGSPAAPYLEEVLYGDWRQQVKERAAAVLREIP